MLPKYTVEFSVGLRKHGRPSHFATDDPVALEEFLVELLERGLRLHSIHHEGLPLEGAEFDRLVKTAAGMLAASRVCASLGIKPEEEKFRFGFAA
ncbi:MAG TPA: hypothetical protein VNO52_03230 [Methylomirabilota bacterium]|nr:hypothetical protein [Methylomirabilota bacterium]